MYDKFTVIIPAHNRPYRLKRLIDYLTFYGCTIVVADSSDKRIEGVDNNEKVKYCHFPNSHLSEKLCLIEPLIETPYVVMCADDDFIIPSSVNKIIDFLEEHSEYGSGQGIYLRYFPKENNSISIDYEWMIDCSLDSDNPLARLYKLFGNYYQFYYAVIRKELFFASFRNLKNNNSILIKNLCLVELYQAIYTTINSKHIVLPCLFNMREYIDTSCSSYIPNYFKLVRYYPNDENLVNYKEQVSTLLNNIRRNGKLHYYFLMSLYYIKGVVNQLKILFLNNKNHLTTNYQDVLNTLPLEDTTCYNDMMVVFRFIDKYKNLIYYKN